MKRLLFLYIPALALLIPACKVSNVRNAEELANERQIAEKVENKELVVEVTQANPMRGQSVYLSFGYDLKIRNDSAYAYLPYFGVAHSAPYGGDGGIKFAALMQDYQVSFAKDSWDIRFKIKDKGYDYAIFLNVFKNGSSHLSVNSYQRDPISFYGKVRE